MSGRWPSLPPSLCLSPPRTEKGRPGVGAPPYMANRGRGVPLRSPERSRCSSPRLDRLSPEPHGSVGGERPPARVADAARSPRARPDREPPSVRERAGGGPRDRPLPTGDPLSHAAGAPRSAGPAVAVPSRASPRPCVARLCIAVAEPCDASPTHFPAMHSRSHATLRHAPPAQRVASPCPCSAVSARCPALRFSRETPPRRASPTQGVADTGPCRAPLRSAALDSAAAEPRAAGLCPRCAVPSPDGTSPRPCSASPLPDAA
jgi:hypothetical protein